MFRDLKEYQEIAKIYAEKVSKPENLEERRGSSSAELAQNRTDVKNKLKGAIGKVKQQVEKNPMGFTLQNP